ESCQCLRHRSAHARLAAELPWSASADLEFQDGGGFDGLPVAADTEPVSRRWMHKALTVRAKHVSRAVFECRIRVGLLTALTSFTQEVAGLKDRKTGLQRKLRDLILWV